MVTGQITNADALLDCSPVDLAALALALESANDNAALPQTDKGRNPLSGSGKFELKSNDGITLPSGTYLFTELILKNKSALRLNGPVRILVTGDIDIKGDVNLGGNPFWLRIWNTADASAKSGNDFEKDDDDDGGGDDDDDGGGNDDDDDGGGNDDDDDGGGGGNDDDDDGGDDDDDGGDDDDDDDDDGGGGNSGPSVKLSSKALVYGFLFSPQGEVELTGQSLLVGGIFADRVEIKGSSEVRRSVDDVAPVIDVTTPSEGDVVEVCEIPVRGVVSDDQTSVSLTVNALPVALADDGSFDTPVSLYTADPGLIELVATDLSGNTTTVRVRVEIVLPVVGLTSPAPDSLIGQRAVTLTGTSGTAVEVTINGQPAVVSGGGFTLADFDLGADGLKTLEIIGTNCGGTGSATVALDLDTTPPVVAIESPVEDDLFGTSPITVTGDVEDAHLASVVVNGVTATVTGMRFVAEGVTLTEGDNTLVAVATDQLGLTTSSAPVTVELDTTAPTASIDVPEPGVIINTPLITVEGDVSDPNLTDVTVNGVPATVTGMRFVAQNVPLSEGSNSLVATAVDRVGNTANSPSVTVILDTLPPEVAIDAAALVRLTADAEIMVSGTVSDPHLDTVTVNGVTATVSNDTWVVDIPIQEGSNQIVAVAVDILGHSAQTPPEEVVRDSTPPEIAITEPAPGDEFDTRTVVVRGTVSDAHLDTVTVEGVAATVTGNTFEATIELPEGDSDIDARAVDVLGQGTNAVPVPVTIDTLPPIVAIDPPANPLVGTETVTVTGTFVEPHLDRILVSGLEAVIAGDTFTVADVPLVEGPNSLVAIASDTFNHETTSAPITWTRDTTPPTVAIDTPANGTVLNTPTITVSGTVDDLHLESVTVNGVVATVDAGRFTATVDLSEGPNTLAATAVDQVANSADSAPWTIVLDTLPPQVAITPPQALTNATSVTVTGTASDAHLDTVTVNGVAATVSGGTFTAPNVPLGSEGSNVLVARAVDILGQATDSAPVEVVRDTTPPQVAIDPASVPDLTDSVTITVTGTVSDAHLAGVTVNGVTATVSGDTFTAPSVPLSEGSNTLVATAVDTLGQSTDSAPETSVLDTLPPEVAIDPASVPPLTNLLAVTVSGTVSDAHLDTVTVNGVTATVTGGTFTAVDVPLTVEGDNTLVAEATDTLDHSTQSAPVVVVRDTLAPELAITEPVPGAEFDTQTITVRGTVADAHLDTITVNGIAATVSGGTWQVTIQLPEGDSDINARAVDVLGQATDAGPVPVTIDTLPPVVGLDEPAAALVNTPTVTVTGTIEEPHLQSLTVNGVAATVTGGTFSATVSLTEGSNDITATASDTFGHTASSNTIAIVLDTLPPEISIDTPLEGALVDTVTITVEGPVSDAHLDTVTVNGVAATVAGGRFSASVTLTEGANVLVATATDLLSQSTDSAPINVTLDTLPPEVAIDASALPDLTADPDVTVTGTVSDPHLDTVTVNGVAATVTGGTFTAAGVALAEGSNDITAIATDTLGHSAETSPVVVVRDSLPPELAITEPVTGAEFDTRTVTVRGTVRDAHLDTVTVRDSVNVSDVTATVTGETWEAILELAEGYSDITARAVDMLGQATDAGPVAVVVDTLDPVVALDPPAAALVNTPSVTVSGTIEEPHLDELTVNGVAATVTDTTFSATIPLTEGSNDVIATASDTFGHTVSTEPIVIVLDTLPPEIAIGLPVEGTIVTSLAVTVEGPVADAHLESVNVNGTPAVVENGRFMVTVPVTDGANTLLATAVDQLGQSSEASVTVFLDTLPPAVTLDEPGIGADECLAAGAPVTLAGRFTDPNPATGQNGQPDAVVIEVRAAGGAGPVSYVGTLSPDGQAWSAAGVDLGTVDGIAAATVTATDVIGNVSRVSRTWRVDAGTPELTLTLDGVPFPDAAPGSTPPAGAQPTLFARQVAAGATVVDGASFAPPDAVLTLDGNPYTAGTPITTEGDHLLVGTVTDCAGHTATVHAFFHVDLSGPALVSTNPADGATLADGIPSYRGTSDTDLATAKVNGKTAAVTDNTFILRPYPWQEGENAVTVELADPAGNTSSHQRTFTVRSLGLTVEIVESGVPIEDGQVFLRAVKPIVRVNDSEADLVATLDGNPFTSGTEISTNGQYTLAANATDALDRTTSATVSFTVDIAEGPVVEITSPGDGTTVAGSTVTVSGSVSGDQPTVSVNGVDAVVTGGTWTAADVPLEPDVLNDLLAEAVDRRERRTAHQVSVLALSSGPQILILEPADGAVTNRSRIDVAGTVVGGAVRTADSTVTVAGTPGIPVATDGAFRALDVALTEGQNVLTAESTDPQGLLSQASVTVLADFTPPVIAISAGSQPLEEGASFSRAITLVVEVSDPGGQVAETAVRLNGSLQSQTELSEIPVEADGGYVVSVVARDAAGNESRAERSFILDLGGCALTDIEPAAGSSVASNQVTLRGRSGTARVVRVRVPDTTGGFQVFAANLADATFLAGDVPLPDIGENALQIVCIDPAGQSHVLNHPLERLAPSSGPTIRITSPVAGDLVDAELIEVSGTTSGGVVTVNGVAAVVTGGNFTASNVPLAEGPNVLGGRVVDASGKVATDRVVIGRDSAAPKVQITSPDDGQAVGIAGAGPAVIDVSGLVDVDSEPNLRRVVVESALGSVVATLDRSTGTYLAEDVPLDPAAPAGEPQTLTARASDTLGHESSVSVDVVLDPEGPAIVLFEPADLTRYSEASPAQITVSGEAWATEGATVSLNGGQFDPADLDWTEPDTLGRLHTTFTASIDLPTQDGAFGVIAKVSDLEDRFAQTRRLLQKDSTAPEVVEMVPADGTEGVDPNSILLVLFSEPILHASLAAADGLTLTRISTSEVVVGAVTVAGNAVGFAPGSGLAPGEL